jgi:lactate racemase
MTKIELGYGRGSVTFRDEHERFDMLARQAGHWPPLTDFAIGISLDSPIDSPLLEDIFAPGDSVLIVVSDATRATASAQVVNLLVRRLVQIGLAPGNIAIIFATGIHRAVTQAEKLELLTPFIVQRIRTIDHDAKAQTWLQLGELDDGTPIELNRVLGNFAHVIVTGAVGFHYFAGFTGGRKSICPGLGSTRTIEATHMLALNFEQGSRRAGVGIGLLDGNPVHEACDRIAEITNPAFCINTTVDEHGRAVRLHAGHWRASHRKACDEYLADHTIRIEEKRNVVVASCGGWPWDINLIQAHKTLEMATHACEPGGTIILLAECIDGLGRSDFLKWFEPRDSQALEAMLREQYEVNGQTAWSLLTKTEKYRVYLVSRIPDDEVRRMRMTPAATLDEALNNIDKSATGYVLPLGPALLPITAER